MLGAEVGLLSRRFATIFSCILRGDASFREKHADMSLSALALTILAILAVGYVVYGRFIASQFRLDDARPTPAVAKDDGVDFVPTKPFYLLGQHFSAIAAAGPIVGPIAACMVFGWLPCVLWIVIGVIFIGAVHDLSALVASVRHGAHSIADIARHNLGRRAYLAIVAFIWISLLYVITAFTDVTALNFVGEDLELKAIQADFNRGGAVASASVLYLALAVVLGLVQWKLRPPMWLVTLVFVPATFLMVWLGTKTSTAMVYDIKVWHAGILAYCFLASLLPLWLLQQPRGYLGGFVLYVSLALGVFGLLFGGFRIEQPAVAPGTTSLWSWLAGGDAKSMPQLLFPFLFVTIACGACSGFHGLVCGGTTSKQVAKESHCTPIAFGAMLMEGFVAIIALATVMIVAPDKAKGFAAAPGVLYGEGLARFFAAIFGDQHMIYAKTFGTMVIATFVFDTLDVATRLGRYLLQELTGRKSRGAGIVAGLLTAGIPLLILRSAEPGSWKNFWSLFGTSNQLLASLTLLGITVWLWRQRKRVWYVAIPMVLVMSVTVTALIVQIMAAYRGAASSGWKFDATLMNAIVALALLALACVFVFEAFAAVRRGRATPEAAA